MEATHTMPHAQGPEKSILSSMLKDPARWIGRAVEVGLTPGDFYLPAHGTLFEVLRELDARGTDVELVSLVELLHDRGLLENLGGRGAIADLYTYAPNAAHFEAHLEHVLHKSLLRQAIELCTEAIGEAYDVPEEVEGWLDSVEERVLAIRHTAGADDAGTVPDLVAEVFAHLRRRIEGEDDERAIATGFIDLDRMAKGGLKPGEMFVVAARPSMGKTSLMMNLVEHVALDQELPVLVFSAEMTGFQLIERLAFSRARFDASRLGKGFRPDKGELVRLKRAAGEISSAPLYIDDTPALPIDMLRAKARRIHREHGIRLVAIDYLQLLRSKSRQAADSREREVGEISSGVKALAKELGIPVVVLAQLNRGPEARTGSRIGLPRMSDLRESGTIEQDADLIGLLYRAAYYADPEDAEEVAGEAELILAKNRNGETGPVPLTFLDKLMRFETRARQT